MRTITNIGYRGTARFITFVLQAFTIVVLAQHLPARDYGIVAFATIFVSFLARFNDLGVGTALVQRRELDDRTVNVALSLRWASGLEPSYRP